MLRTGSWPSPAILAAQTTAFHGTQNVKVNRSSQGGKEKEYFRPVCYTLCNAVAQLLLWGIMGRLLEAAAME